MKIGSDLRGGLVGFLSVQFTQAARKFLPEGPCLGFLKVALQDLVRAIGGFPGELYLSLGALETRDVFEVLWFELKLGERYRYVPGTARACAAKVVVDPVARRTVRDTCPFVSAAAFPASHRQMLTALPRLAASAALTPASVVFDHAGRRTLPRIHEKVAVPIAARDFLRVVERDVAAADGAVKRVFGHVLLMRAGLGPALRPEVLNRVEAADFERDEVVDLVVFVLGVVDAVAAEHFALRFQRHVPVRRGVRRVAIAHELARRGHVDRARGQLRVGVEAGVRSERGPREQ